MLLNENNLSDVHVNIPFEKIDSIQQMHGLQGLLNNCFDQDKDHNIFLFQF